MNQITHGESERRIHVLFFTPSLGNGGAEMHLLRLLNHLDRKQFRLSVALAQTGGTYEASLAEDVTVHALNPSGIRSSTLRILRAIAPLRQLVQTEQPDILCAFQDHANLVAMWACRNLSHPPKLLLGVQNNVSALYSRRYHPLHLFVRSQMKALYPQADRIIALSHGVAIDLKEVIPEVGNLIEVIYNAGVDSKVVNGAKELLFETQPPQDEPLIVACGRLHPQKGFPYLLTAMRQIRNSIPAHLWIVGEGSERLALEAQIQQLGLTDCVRLVGFQKNPYQYMAAADVFVLSSLYEGFGNVVVEAMACGTPVVATDCPYGPGEIIEDGVSGLLVPPANADALAQSILRVLTDPGLQQDLSRNGQVRSQDFHAETIAASYANLFQQFFGSKAEYSASYSN
ncbi:MAG TPA: glycosyltransferase [Synechococcales cyanobacterium M55_K2018_004]|nr:glycosyltransferase [Synechococcales cyanobacterium M55_K2018_004]